MIHDPNNPLYAAILADRLDDVPRLVYADWLEENGDPDRAEFIRVQVRIADPLTDPVQRMDDARQDIDLNNSHAAHWMRSEVGDCQLLWYGPYRRGFRGMVQLNHLASLTPDALELVRSIPVTHLELAQPITLFADDLRGTILEILAAIPCLSVGTNQLDSTSFSQLGDHIGRSLRGLKITMWITSTGQPRVITDRPQAMRLQGLEKFRCLSELDLGSTTMTLAQLRELVGYDLPLESLRLDSTQLSMEGLRELCQSTLAKSLIRLNLGNNPLRGCESIGIKSIDRPTLRTLNLERCRLTPNDLAWFAAHPMLNRLRVWNLEDNPIGPSGLRALIERFHGTALHTLTLGGCSLADPDGEQLARSPIAGGIRSLNLRDNDLRTSQFAFLESWREMGRLGILNVRGNPIGEIGLRHILGTGPERSTLRSLNLSNCRLTAIAARIIREARHVNHLDTLHLGGNPLGDEGLQALIESAHLTSLRSLNLAQTEITDVGIHMLLGETPFRHGIELHLGNNPIDSDQKPDFLDALRNKYGSGVYL